MGIFTKSNDRFVDMHNHILPGIDDGARDKATTLEMLRIAAKSGITDMIVTPHFKYGRHNASCEKIVRLIEEIESEAENVGIHIKLYPGNEIFYYDGCAEDLVEGKIYSLNDTDRALVEFQPGERYVYIRNAIDTIIGAGYVPVIAHVERYMCILDNPDLAYELRNLGAEIQVNSASIEGRLGLKTKKFVIELLKNEQVDYVGTDAHDFQKRAPEVKKCMAVLHRICDDEYVRRITCDNALSIIEA